MKDCYYPHTKGTFWEWKLSFLNVSFLWLWKNYKVWHTVYWWAPASLISKPVTKCCIAVAVLKWKTFIISWKTVLSWAHSQRFSLLKLLKLVLQWDITENKIAVPSATCATKEGGGSLSPRGSKCRTIWRNYKEKITWAASCLLKEITQHRYTSSPGSPLSFTLQGLSHLKAYLYFDCFTRDHIKAKK